VRAEIRLIWWRSSGAQHVQGVSGFCACLTEVRSPLLRHVPKDAPYSLPNLLSVPTARAGNDCDRL